MSRNLIEAIVGAIVLGAAIFFVIFGYSHSRWAPVEGYALHALFDRVDGLAVGSDVRISGVKVGAVSEMTIDPATYLADVRFVLGNKHHIPKDSTAEVVSDGLLGSKYLALVPGGDEEILKPNEKITRTQSAVSLESLIGKMVFNKADDKKQKSPSAHAPDHESVTAFEQKTPT